MYVALVSWVWARKGEKHAAAFTAGRRVCRTVQGRVTLGPDRLTAAGISSVKMISLAAIGCVVGHVTIRSGRSVKMG